MSTNPFNQNKIRKGAYGEVTFEDDIAVKRQKFIEEYESKKTGKKYNMISRTALKECNYLMFMTHKNIIIPKKVEIDDDFLFIAMEKGEPLDVNLVMDEQNIFKQLLEGLIYMHDNNIVHGDIKSGNIVIDKDDNPKFIDFGSSAYIESRELLGTYQYAGPEVFLDGKRTFEGDVWSLGVVFLELIEKRNIAKIVFSYYKKAVKPEEFYAHIIKYVDEKYSDTVLSKMLNPNSYKRSTARQIYKEVYKKDYPLKVEKTEVDFIILQYPIGKITDEIKENLLKKIKYEFRHLREEVMEFFVGNFTYWMSKYGKKLSVPDFYAKGYLLAHIVQLIFADKNELTYRTPEELAKTLKIEEEDKIYVYLQEILHEMGMVFMRN
jgi:serine/threonine protein kinase